MKGEKELLLWLVRLFRLDPAFAFYVSTVFTSRYTVARDLTIYDAASGLRGGLKNKITIHAKQGNA